MRLIRAWDMSLWIVALCNQLHVESWLWRICIWLRAVARKSLGWGHWGGVLLVTLPVMWEQSCETSWGRKRETKSAKLSCHCCAQEFSFKQRPSADWGSWREDRSPRHPDPSPTCLLIHSPFGLLELMTTLGTAAIHKMCRLAAGLVNLGNWEFASPYPGWPPCCYLVADPILTALL